MNRHALWLLAGLAGAFVALRLMLLLDPDSDLFVAGYNIHHLFTGLVLITVAAPPLALDAARGRKRDLLVLTLGAGLGMALDEWVYLIATDGSNAAYLTPVSFRGGLLLVSLAAGYVAVLGRVTKR